MDGRGQLNIYFFGGGVDVHYISVQLSRRHMCFSDLLYKSGAGRGLSAVCTVRYGTVRGGARGDGAVGRV